MTLDDSIKLLARAIGGMCEEIRALRDDLYNHALITRGDAFGGMPALATGTRQIATSAMPTAADTAGTENKAFENKSSRPVVAVVRCEPYWSGFPPNAISIENSALLVSVSSAEATSARTAAFKYGAGDPVIVVVPPGGALFISAMASAAVSVSWRVYSLVGRRSVFSE